MAKYKHLTLSERYDIEKYLNQRFNYSEIGRLLNKSDRTIAYEIKKHSQKSTRNKFNNYCLFPCEKLNHTPFLCNGCEDKAHCRKNKYFYYGKDANDNYKELLVTSRNGIDMKTDEFNDLNSIVKDEVADKGHSFAMIIRTHKNEISKTKRTLYNYLEKGYLDINNLDVPRKVRYKIRKKKQEVKIRKIKIREGRTYQDFIKYKDEYFKEHYEEANIVQMDTVVGPNIENQSCILTLLFENSRFLMIFKLANKTMSEVDKVFDYLRSTLGLDLFSYLFQIILTDNGSEFFDVNHIENNEAYPKTHLFFCDPMQSQQKGRIEVAHEYIRRYIPKGSSFNDLSQDDLTFIANNINSISRDKLRGMNAFKIQEFFTPNDFFTKLNFKEINSKDIIIKKYN